MQWGYLEEYTIAIVKEASAGEVKNCSQKYQLIICMCICMLKLKVITKDKSL